MVLPQEVRCFCFSGRKCTEKAGKRAEKCKALNFEYSRPMKDTVAFEGLHGSITTLIYIYKTGKKRAFSILHTPPIRVRITPSTGVPQHRLKRKKGSTHHAKPVIGYRDTLEAVPYASRRNLLMKAQCPRRKRGSSPYLGNPHHASWQEKHAGHGTTANNCKHGQLHSQIKQKTLKEAKNQCFIDRKGKKIHKIM